MRAKSALSYGRRNDNNPRVAETAYNSIKKDTIFQDRRGSQGKQQVSSLLQTQERAIAHNTSQDNLSQRSGENKFRSINAMKLGDLNN
jgi:hypothetical protein